MSKNSETNKNMSSKIYENIHDTAAEKMWGWTCRADAVNNKYKISKSKSKSSTFGSWLFGHPL